MKPEFPISIRSGSVVVKIYRQESANVYTLNFYEEGQRRRLSFSALEAARLEARNTAERLSRRKTGDVVLKGEDVFVYARALHCLNPHSVRLDVAASEYAQGLSLLNGKGTLLEAARHFAATNAGEIKPVRTQALVDDLIQAREANHASKRHLQDARRAATDGRARSTRHACIFGNRSFCRVTPSRTGAA